VGDHPLFTHFSPTFLTLSRVSADGTVVVLSFGQHGGRQHVQHSEACKLQLPMHAKDSDLHRKIKASLSSTANNSKLGEDQRHKATSKKPTKRTAASRELFDAARTKQPSWGCRGVLVGQRRADVRPGCGCVVCVVCVVL